MVAVPDFSEPLPQDELSAPLRVLLYIFPDGTAGAEHYLDIREAHDPWAIRTVRATGLPLGGARHAACGSAYDRYDPAAVQLLKATTSL